MNILGLFSKRSKKITYCGRAGLIYDRDGQKYSVDSEMLSGKPDIVVYWSDIFPNDNRYAQIPEDIKKEIALEVKKELEFEGLTVELHPAIF